jgi:hypothetical protein
MTETLEQASEHGKTSLTRKISSYYWKKASDKSFLCFIQIAKLQYELHS